MSSSDAKSRHATTSHEHPFVITLSQRERRLAGRLEGFGDIVFGFAVSQCALQLPLIDGRVDFTQPFALVVYFGTFAVLATLWLTYHTMMSGAFKPSGKDLLLPFAFLAVVSLTPYAMHELAQGGQSVASARTAMLSYLSLYIVLTALAAICVLRNLRRGYAFMEGDDRDRAWVGFVRQVVLFGMMSAALIVDLVAGPAVAGFFLLLITVAIRLAKRRFARAPSERTLRISQSEFALADPTESAT